MSLLSKHKKAVIALLTTASLTLTLGLSGCAAGGQAAGSSPEGSSVAVSAGENGLSAQDSEQLDSDVAGGLLFLVNKDKPVDESYAPDDLVNITKYYAEDRSSVCRYMRSEAAEHFYELVEAAQAEDIDIVMTTAYRAYDFQQILWDNGVKNKGSEEAANKTIARPGESEHQTGLAVDLSTSEIDYRNSSDFGDTAAGKWVAENAYKYGFILRFPQDKTEETGYSYEAWHIRYVGSVAAKQIYDSQLCLEEYLTQQGIDGSVS